jgi:MFS family permease
MWRYRNFGVLVGLALLPYFWWVTSFVSLTAWWEQVYGWSAINTAVHFLPMGIGAWLISNFTGRLPTWFAHKYILLVALFLTVVATVLLPFSDAPDRYWPFAFPAFLLGTVGMMIVFANSSIAIFSYTPPSVAGTVGAVFNCALQLGSAVGLAAVSSIQTSVDVKNAASLSVPLEEFSQHLGEISQSTWRTAYQGRAASFWFLLGILVLEVIAVVVFFKVDMPIHDEEPKVSEKTDVEAAQKH